MKRPLYNVPRPVLSRASALLAILGPRGWSARECVLMAWAVFDDAAKEAGR